MFLLQCLRAHDPALPACLLQTAGTVLLLAQRELARGSSPPPVDPNAFRLLVGFPPALEWFPFYDGLGGFPWCVMCVFSLLAP